MLTKKYIANSFLEFVKKLAIDERIKSFSIKKLKIDLTKMIVLAISI